MRWMIMPGGLIGSLSDTSGTGAKFTGGDISTGRIRAYDMIHNMVGFTYGSVLAGGNGTINDTSKNDTNKTTPDNPNPGDSGDCRIRQNPLPIRPGMKKSFSIWCNGPKFEDPCPSTTKFSFSDNTVGQIVDYNINTVTGKVYGAYLIVYQPPSKKGSYTLGAMLDSTSGKGCSANVDLNSAACWEFA
jgi:hypothetical protein